MGLYSKAQIFRRSVDTGGYSTLQLIMAAEPLPSAPLEHFTPRQEIENAFASISSVIKASARPLPTQTGDGSYITAPPTTGILDDLVHMGFKDVETIAEVLKAGIWKKPINDRTYLMENVIKVSNATEDCSVCDIDLCHCLVCC